jgi:hypothetical protein
MEDGRDIFAWCGPRGRACRCPVPRGRITELIVSPRADKSSCRTHDLFCTFCHALKINPRKENLNTEGRPLKIVDGGKAVKELF